MFGLGMPELMVIAVIALIIFGPKRLPEMGRSVGSALREFKKGAESITGEVKEIADVGDIGKDLKSINKEMAETGKAVTESVQNPMTDKTTDKTTDTAEESAEKEPKPTEPVKTEKSAEKEPKSAEPVKST